MGFKSCRRTNEVWLRLVRIMDVSLRESGFQFHENRLPCCLCVCVMSHRGDAETRYPPSTSSVTQPSWKAKHDYPAPSGFQRIIATRRLLFCGIFLWKITEQIETLDDIQEGGRNSFAGTANRKKRPNCINLLYEDFEFALSVRCWWATVQKSSVLQEKCTEICAVLFKIFRNGAIRGENYCFFYWKKQKTVVESQ